jgi:hypothetical protein
MKVMLINSRELVVVLATMICFSGEARAGICISDENHEFDLDYCVGDNCTTVSFPGFNMVDQKSTCLSGGGRYFNITCQNDCSYLVKDLTETFMYGYCITGNGCVNNSVAELKFDENNTNVTPQGYYRDTTPAAFASSSCNVTSQGADTGGSVTLVIGPPCMFPDGTGASSTESKNTSAAIGSQALMSFARLLALAVGAVVGAALL